MLAVYGLFFSLGWWLQRNGELLTIVAGRWKTLLTSSLLLSAFAFGGLWMRYDAPPDTPLRWATSFATALTMALASLGWLGLFVRFFEQPSHRARYLADASYWLYLAHLPVVVAMQIWLASWDAHWALKIVAVNAMTFGLLLATYHRYVRFTWLGAWLNGPRTRTPALAAERA